MREYKSCPYCASLLKRNAQGFLACECGFVHWDNPVPVVACVVPMQHRWLVDAGISTAGIPDGGLLLVQRDKQPFEGEWCFACGFMEKHGHPKDEAARETMEETGIRVRIERMLCACNPMPGEINQIVISYLARPVGGILKHGDDARSVGVFTRENMPELCFRSHRMLRDQWFAGNLGDRTGEDLLI